MNGQSGGVVSCLVELRETIREQHYADETAVVQSLADEAGRVLCDKSRAGIVHRARRLVRSCRAGGHRAGTLDVFLQEFGLSNREGVALMCLAEALLRIPDNATADKLIREKIREGEWTAHLGRSDSGFVNASVWGLMLTGKLVTPEADALSDPGAWLRRLVSRMGEPVVRKAMLQAMRILGRQFVLGRDIGEAMRRSRAHRERGVRFSFDMLGEGARTFSDAEGYFRAYRHAIDAIGALERANDPVSANGISVKLSALHPRFELARLGRLSAELAPRIKSLALRAKSHGLGFSIDAEEASRLEPTMDLFEALAREPELAGWDGLGFVLQAYQKRAPCVADWLVALAGATARRLTVRLVKGAYWDTEIKHAQEHGLPDYPVFSRKANTDLCYEVCAARLLAAGPETIFPQFATHNAHTACTVLALVGKYQNDSGSNDATNADKRVESDAIDTDHANSDGIRGARSDSPSRSLNPQGESETCRFEFQRLHGMGHTLYARMMRDTRQPLRIYAPVGSHRHLLPYLVRRLLENGANSSFVNRFLDSGVPVDVLIRDTLARIASHGDHRHAHIPAPTGIYRLAGEQRTGAAGIDLDAPQALSRLMTDVRRAKTNGWRADAIVGGGPHGATAWPVPSPSDRRVTVGLATESGTREVDAALELAVGAQPQWNAIGGKARGSVLDGAADLLEARHGDFIYLIAAEGGRTLEDALAEVREAVDFCRYYGLQARQKFEAPLRLPGPTGEVNELRLTGRGVFACISPWNFPLAIFLGQVTAALAAGNSVLAKPAEQTPLVAAEAARLLHEAGVPEDVLQFLPGQGSRVGAQIVGDGRVGGVAFTGSMETARQIEQDLAGRPGPIVPLIAETGGQNVMLVDSTALPEQVVDDVIVSAFQSAGQRCSALRVLYVQDEIADEIMGMLAGAMRTLVIGEPLDRATDIGPVIDEQAQGILEQHVATMNRSGRLVARCGLPSSCKHGSFFAPHAFEIDSIRRLQREVFGPVLHIVRYRASDLDVVIGEIEATGYGLTLGVHSRIEGFAREVFEKTRAGNVYINRNMIGAVVGVHPFGGRGLSGTGPKAGGPHYLLRFASERTLSDNVTAKGGNVELFGLQERWTPLPE